MILNEVTYLCPLILQQIDVLNELEMENSTSGRMALVGKLP
jgi:hypothetical protein